MEAVSEPVRRSRLRACPHPEPEGGGEKICLWSYKATRYAIFLVRAELEKGWDLVPRTVPGRT